MKYIYFFSLKNKPINETRVQHIMDNNAWEISSVYNWRPLIDTALTALIDIDNGKIVTKDFGRNIILSNGQYIPRII